MLHNRNRARCYNFQTTTELCSITGGKERVTFRTAEALLAISFVMEKYQKYFDKERILRITF
jgi:hypothetical protein